jgi:putative colanic acid biosynthesis acetyltransferase WcaF
VPLQASKSKPLEGGASFPLRHRLVRAAWNIMWLLLASWTPPFMYPWRYVLLSLFGARLEWPCDVRASARIWYPPNLMMGRGSIIAAGVDCYNMGEIVVGAGAIVSRRATLCCGSHDVDDANFQLFVGRIMIDEGAWIAAEAFVGPDVVVGRRAVLGARAVAFSDLEPETIYVGNPARPLRKRTPIDEAWKCGSERSNGLRPRGYST